MHADVPMCAVVSSGPFGRWENQRDQRKQNSEILLLYSYYSLDYRNLL